MKHLYSLVLVLIALTSSHLTYAQIIPNVTYTNDNTITCSGTASAAPTGGTGAYAYLWSTGETTSSISNLCAGNYTVIIQDANQDTASFSFMITNPCWNLTINLSTTDCTPGNCDGTIQMTVTGGTAPYTYNWSNGAGMTVQNQANICAGTYSVICTDMNGCTTSSNTTVSDPSIQNTIVANLTSTDDSTGTCNGSASVSPTGGSGGYSYMWSSGQTTSSISNLCAGTYTVLITDSNQDTTIASCVITNLCSAFTVTYTSIPASTPATCDGSVICSPVNGTAPYTYTWSNGNTTQSISNLCVGTYNLTCTDVNGCSFIGSISVFDSIGTVIPLSLNLASTDDYTGNCTGSASISATGGTAPYTVLWSNGQNGGFISNLCSGIYSVTVWDSGSDSTTVSFVIADSSSTYNNNPFPNGAINDTLYTDLVANCIIDYNTIDSTSLYQAVYNSSSQSLYVTWAVYSPTDTVYISDTLALIGNPGYYSLTISVYCPNKSGNDFFKIESVIYFDGTNVWLSPTLGMDEQLLDNLTLYPNPFSNSISVDNKDGVLQSLKLIDLNGRVLSEMNQVNSGLVKLDQLESISSGTYLLILSGENTSKTYKVIK